MPISIIAMIERTIETFPIILPSLRDESDELTGVDYLGTGGVIDEKFFTVNVREALQLRSLIRDSLLEAFPKSSDSRVKFSFNVDEKEVGDFGPFASICERHWSQHEISSRTPTTANPSALRCVVDIE